MIDNMKKVSNEILAYLAGFVDGEGHITAIKTKAKRSDWNASYSAQFGITNTSREILEYIRNITGFGIIHSKNSRKANWKDAWVLTFNVNEAEILLIKLLPYLVLKKSQAILLLALMSLRMTKGQVRQLTTVDEQVEKDILYEELRKLNKRGK